MIKSQQEVWFKIQNINTASIAYYSKSTSPKIQRPPHTRNEDNLTKKLRLSHPKKVNNLIQNMKTTSPNKLCNKACKLLNMDSLRQKIEIMNVQIVTFEQPIAPNFLF